MREAGKNMKALIAIPYRIAAQVLPERLTFGPCLAPPESVADVMALDPAMQREVRGGTSERRPGGTARWDRAAADRCFITPEMM